MTVPRGPPRRPTAGDPWAGARKSRVRPRVHSECGESERTARLWERPALPRRRGCGACGVCGARRVLWGAQQGRESRGAEGARTRPRQGVCPAQGFRKGPKAQPSCRPLATGKVAGPHSLGSGEATLPQEPELCQGSGCPESVPHSTPAVHPGTRLSSSQSAVPWVAAGETEVGGAGSVHQVPNTIWGQPPLSPPPLCDQREQGSCRPQSSGRMGGSSLGCPVLESQQPRPVSRGVCLDQRGHLPWPVTC